MHRKEISMTIEECCEYLKNKSTVTLVKEIVEIENKPEKLEKFEEVLISKSRQLLYKKRKNSSQKQIIKK